MPTPYDIILADPPWRFENWDSSERATRGEHWGRANGRSPYDTMDTADIAALPVAQIAHRDTVLFLWATAPKLPDALAVMQAWGFVYRTRVFTWVKLTRQAYRNFEQWQAQGKGPEEILARLFHAGTGFWSLQNAEDVLVGRRKGGKLGPRRGTRSLIVTPVGAHSVKPLEVHRRIVRICGDRPRIEQFDARPRVAGWDAIGDGIDGLDIRASLRRVQEGLPLPGVGAPTVRGSLTEQQQDLLWHLLELERYRDDRGIPWRPGLNHPEWNEACRASASRTLKRLERRGLLHRVRPGGRTTHVEWTPAGLALVQSWTEDGAEGVRKLTAGL